MKDFGPCMEVSGTGWVSGWLWECGAVEKELGLGLGCWIYVWL